MAADVDLLILAELNPDVLVSAADVEVRFGQVEQLIENATVTLGSSGAITACAAAAQGLRVAVCAVTGDDPIGEWTREQLRGHGVDVTGVTARPGRATGLSVVLTRAGGDRAILTFPGTMTELSAADVPPGLLARARHVHASSFFLQRGLQADLPALFAQARSAGATTSLDTGWAPDGEWAAAGPVLAGLSYLLPNEAECAHLARALVPAAEPGSGPGMLACAAALASLGPAVAVKLGAAGGLIVGSDGAFRVHGRPVEPLDTTGAGDCFNAGFLAGLLDGELQAGALRRAVASGSAAVTGWGGTGALATREQAERAGAELVTDQLAIPAA
ncbi:MAG TPA: carbohydrate kinase family protein [Streptosporangiaceae bacterium]